jgi:steroid delta-isomerase-like uncharacterized protein
MLEQNKATIEQTVRIWNTGDLALADQTYTADFVNHDPNRPNVTDMDSLMGVITEIRTAMPDFKVTLEDIIAEGDKVVTRWTSQGTHEGIYVGIPPTGKKASWTGVTIARCESSGKVAETWWSYDMLGALQQLGVVPTMQAE